MTETTLARPLIEIRDLKLPPWWLLIVYLVGAVVLMQGLLILGREPARWIWMHGPADWKDRPWIFVTIAILFQAIIGFIAVVVMKRLLPQADAYVRWPPGKSYVGLGLLIGFAMALIMLVADYWPQLLSHTAIHDYPTDPVNASGWLFALGITGFAEEPIFRGLLVGALAFLIPGRIRIGALDLPAAAYIVALLFGAAHYDSFLVSPLYLATAQLIYAFIWGLAYVWLMERSKSLLAPIIAHGVSDAAEVGAVIAIAILWGG
ncbi:MAG: CPBP family intramembrane glutamic endopeptidase [Alphaproteobacteria bacterium]